MFSFFTKILPNGLRIVFIPTGSPSVAVNLSVGAGSKYEEDNIRGLSHFLEHMSALKGTETRPSPYLLRREFEKVGANYNAGTGKEKTSYYARCAPEHMELLMDLISDVVLRPML